MFRPAFERPIELCFQPVEGIEAVAWQRVPELVDEAREAIEGEQVGADPPRKHSARDREVLRAGPCHHGVGRRSADRGIGYQHHPFWPEAPSDMASAPSSEAARQRPSAMIGNVSR